jgi:hypothetical protein
MPPDRPALARRHVEVGLSPLLLPGRQHAGQQQRLPFLDRAGGIPGDDEGGISEDV